MSNEYNIIAGMRPFTPPKPEYCRVVSVDASNTLPLFIGSPSYLVAGKLRAIPGQTTNIRGAVLKLMDTTRRPCNSIPASTAGYAEICEDPEQLYVMTVDDTAFAGVADINKTYDIVIEDNSTNPGSTDRYGSAGRSKVELDGSQEHNTDGQIKVMGITGTVNNAGGVAHTEVIVKINEYQA